MALTDEQKSAIARWIDEGAKPADVQSRIAKEFDIHMTYMEVRFLIDDLKLMPKDAAAPEPPKPAEPEASASVEDAGPDEALPASAGKVSVTVDTLARPGAMVSGRATMSDGKSVEWYLDQFGRLGMVGPEPGYRPPQEDIMEFQAALDRELQKMGM
jgi:hypothetical protein